MKIGMLMARHPRSKVSPIMPEVVELLTGWGAEVETICPDDELTPLSDLRAEHDVYVLKSGSELALSLAGALHEAGATIVNPYPVAAACRDKVIATSMLQSAGVPTPETYLAAHVCELGMRPLKLLVRMPHLLHACACPSQILARREGQQRGRKRERE